MPRIKKQRLKKRADGRYCCKYHGIQFMGWTEDEALRAREDYKQQEANRDLLKGRLTVAEFALPWLPRAHPTVAQSTYTGLAIHLQKLLDQIGDVQLSEVLPSQIQQVYTDRYKTASNKYISAAKQLYRALFDAAMADGYCRTNPARERAASPHRGTEGGHRAITPQEREWIETLCTDHRAHAAVMAMLYAGLRPQEMKAVNIDTDVDFEGETITLSRFAHLETPYTYALTEKGKTDNAARVIPLLPQLKTALEGHHGYLITDAKGQRVNVQAWKCVWKSYVFQMEKAINGCEKRWYGKTREHKAILAAGGKLPPWIPFTVVPYDLRHSFCTMCRDNGVELNTCIYWMGHADAKMILKIYDEVSDARTKNEAERLKKSLIGMQNGMQIG